MVDGFNFQNARCKNYFLTHFHSDHTTGKLCVVCNNIALFVDLKGSSGSVPLRFQLSSCSTSQVKKMLLGAGLGRAFSSGVIYCSPITATLLTKDMGMPAERVIPLPMDTPIVIDGVSVTLMDANHCPGACMMLFKVPTRTGKPQVLALTDTTTISLPSNCLISWLSGPEKLRVSRRLCLHLPQRRHRQTSLEKSAFHMM